MSDLTNGWWTRTRLALLYALIWVLRGLTWVLRQRPRPRRRR
jgi:hypothetical protein